MHGDLPTRRQVLKAAAAIGVVAMVSAVAARTVLPATKPAAPLVGIQIGAGPLLTGNIGCLTRCVLLGALTNYLFFAFGGHEVSGCADGSEGFRGGNYSIPHMEYYKDSNLSYAICGAAGIP